MENKNPLIRFWISWTQLTEDTRPLTDPPQPENIKAWWKSGEDAHGAGILCAVVDAGSTAEAERCIKEAWDATGAEIGEFRFIVGHDLDWLPAGDRFPITNDWEKERLGIK